MPGYVPDMSLRVPGYLPECDLGYLGTYPSMTLRVPGYISEYSGCFLLAGSSCTTARKAHIVDPNMEVKM